MLYLTKLTDGFFHVKAGSIYYNRGFFRGAYRKGRGGGHTYKFETVITWLKIKKKKKKKTHTHTQRDPMTHPLSSAEFLC